MTKYTDDQVNEAIMLANQTSKVYAWETEMYRDVIEHLPEPAQDGWQECTFEDIRKGDRVKRVFTFPNGSVGVSEGIAAKKEPGFSTHWRWVDQDGLILGVSSDNNDPHVTFSRIPAKVVHPDPAEHPIIMEQGGKGWVWSAQHEMYYQPHGTEYRFPEGFTEWSPAQINSEEPAEAPQ